MKITISRLLETSRYLATDAGKQLSDMITQLADFMEQGVRALRAGLTFRDNFDQETKTVSLKNDTATTVAVTAGKTVTGVLVQRVVSSTHALDSFLWYYDSNSRLTLKATFTGSPAATDSISIEAIFLY